MQLYKPYQTLLGLLTFHHIPDEPKEIWKVKFKIKSQILLIFSYKKDFDQKILLTDPTQSSAWKRDMRL